MKSNILSALMITSYATLNTTAIADETITLDPIVIGADFREKKLSQTSNSVTLISEGEIYDKASKSFVETLASTPNVNFSSGASKAKYIQIRGIGERSQFETPVNPSVGIIVDGIDSSNTTLGMSMFDVKQIEVLKGPQGTTFGANAMAGMVVVESNEPSKKTQGHIEATVGDYNTKAVGVAVGGTLLEDKLLGRFSIYKNTSDGYMKNSYLDRKDTQNIDELSIKQQLRWLVSDEHTIDFNYSHTNVDNGYDAFTFDNSRVSLADEPGKDTQKTNAFAIKSTNDFNKFQAITKLSYSNSDMTYSFDEDWANEDYYPGENWKGSDEYIRNKEYVDFDLRLISNESNRIFNGATDWTIGTYYKNYQESLERNRLYVDLYDNNTVYNTEYDGDYKTENKAIYGQLDTHLNEKVTFITGLRVENVESDYTDSNATDISTDETLLGARIGLNYAINNTDLYYMSISRGYKPGGVNSSSEIPDAAREFKTETLWNIDIGANNSYLDNTLLSRLNLFYGKRKDQQVKSSYVQNPNDPDTSFDEYFTNAAKGTYYGLEAQLSYHMTESLYVYGSLGLLKSKFDEYTDPNPDATDVNGRAPAQSPEYQHNIGLNYFINDDWTFKANMEGKASYYFSNRHNEKAKSSTIGNASLEYIYKGLSTSFWIRNITDEKTEVRGFGSFGNNPANGWETELYTQSGAPRTIGITLSYDF
ncbi:TonB-dependent receptor [Poseidonibacter lekithochrous]|uniref:TonB-dependent receptor n=1 Tax=Poseidonibacter TaxID=2321187 RepID=UPI001C085824|nr:MULTISPECIES: TonB-dependent receptor [Poseidonibacter]MBU3014901.1 TonB-dependent receptor [Poseidonibacter lekithochrous]MDO6828199.1 TonB-dependent receptor [Poseidonibacter sp. 1_MG-2023]